MYLVVMQSAYNQGLRQSKQMSDEGEANTYAAALSSANPLCDVYVCAVTRLYRIPAVPKPIQFVMEDGELVPVTNETVQSTGS